MNDRKSTDPMTEVLADFRRPDRTEFQHAWVGIEPTFQSKKSIRKWAKYTSKKGGEDAYFVDDYMVRKQREVARHIQKSYKRLRKEGHPACMFARVERDTDLDQWQIKRQNLLFHWDQDEFEPFEVRFTLDPETFEYSIKPIPLAWFYDDRFVTFMEEFLWKPPQAEGLTASIAHGGGQFSMSAKTVLGGTLLADIIATMLNHPELCTLIMDWPNPDDRAFRATRPRFEAFREVLRHYWAGAFHPRALGTLTVANAYGDHGFGPAHSPPKGLVDPQSGPQGSPRDVFQNNFAFGIAARLMAQNVHPGYWQAAHPKEEGYRPDQIMRYSEGNLNRLQIAGELHVKSGKVLDPERVPEYDAPLEIDLLYDECSWENRGQMGRTSARDYVEALLLDIHHALYLQKYPGVKVANSLEMDQLLIDGEDTLKRHGESKTLDLLHQQAREINLEVSGGRIKSDWIEPETLFWSAWRVLPAKEKAGVAREVVKAFVERVEQATEFDPRPSVKANPMEWHRHRIHPELWKALEQTESTLNLSDPAHRELQAWQEKRDEYLARRPVFSQADLVAPWEAVRE